METNFLWGSVGSVIHLLTTEMNALATGTLTAAGPEINNSSGYQQGLLSLHMASAAEVNARLEAEAHAKQIADKALAKAAEKARRSEEAKKRATEAHQARLAQREQELLIEAEAARQLDIDKDDLEAALLIERFIAREGIIRDGLRETLLAQLEELRAEIEAEDA